MLSRVNPAPVGTIVYLQDGARPMGVSRFWSPIFRNPWIVEAWHNREYATGTRAGSVYIRGGHLATVRSLRDGRRCTVADWFIRACLEL